MEVTFKSDIDVELIQHMGSDETIANAAWVSTKGMCDLKQSDETKVPGLINYLMKSRHGSPFEAGGMTFRVHAPIFVWREWHRHRVGHSFNEESGRYKQLDPVFYLPPKDRPMFKVDSWKPGRPKFLPILNQAGESAYGILVRNLKLSYEVEYKTYEQNLGLGIDPGLARDCLPVGIYSACWVTMNPRSVMHFLSLRTHEPDAKFVSYPLWEIDQAARKVEEIFKKLFPITHEAFVKNGRVAP